MKTDRSINGLVCIIFSFLPFLSKSLVGKETKLFLISIYYPLIRQETMKLDKLCFKSSPSSTQFNKHPLVMPIP